MSGDSDIQAVNRTLKDINHTLNKLLHAIEGVKTNLLVIPQQAGPPKDETRAH